jgi:glycine/D-amino acid oxidase-like deaminating enzyme
LWELTSENLVRLEILLERSGLRSEKVGSLRLANDAKQSTEFRNSATQLKEYGYAVTLEDDSRYGEQVAISTSDDLLFMPQELVSKLLEHENIIVELDAEVEGIKRQPDGSIAVAAHKRYLWTRKVVFANGIHAIRQDPALAEILHPACVHTIVFENTKTLVHPLILDSGRVLFVPYGDDAYLTGWDNSEVDILWRLGAVANQLCPDALISQRFTSWVAVRDDRLPVVGEIPGQPDTYTINGLGPFGLNLALVAAEELAELVLHNRQPTLFSIAQP